MSSIQTMSLMTNIQPTLFVFILVTVNSLIPSHPYSSFPTVKILDGSHLFSRTIEPISTHYFLLKAIFTLGIALGTVCSVKFDKFMYPTAWDLIGPLNYPQITTLHNSPPFPKLFAMTHPLSLILPFLGMRNIAELMCSVSLSHFDYKFKVILHLCVFYCSCLSLSNISYIW